MIEHLLKNLNPAQYKAVTTTEGPLLVIAGAGSGKTRVLTTRVAYILGRRLAEPYNILAVTFTNKAAREMKDRIIALLGYEIHTLQVSTFHSFCAMLLRREAGEIGYPSNFIIYDEEDSRALIKNCLDELELSRSQFTPQALKKKISAAKNRMEDATAFAEKASGYFESKTARVYELYESKLRQYGVFDFDDLIYHSVRLLQGNEKIREQYRSKLKYILVDEYQDTNHSQYNLLKLLIGRHRNICVVGDEDQSIYGWRGADITNILNFEKDFPGAEVIKLEQNYRSTSIILDAASAVIANNIDRKGKKLWTELSGGDKIKLYITQDAAEEASVVIDSINRERSRYPLKEMVILYRTNAQSRQFEEHLLRMNIPYQIIGGVSFYQRKEIKDLMAYLKLLANPGDDISFQRIINYPLRGIGETTIGRIREFALEKGISMYEAGRRIEENELLGNRPRKLVKKFIDFMEPFFELKKDENIASLSRKLVDTLKLPEYLIEEDAVLGPNRVENIEEFVAAAEEFTASYDEPTLEHFLAEISLYTDIDSYREIEDKLTLMTLHTAKGLEFSAVYLVGLEEGLFPLIRSTEDPKQLEEERRLFYVGATRAKRNLYISMAMHRGRFGSMGSIPSRFLKELPPGLVDVEDFRREGTVAANNYRGAKAGDSSRADEGGIRYEYEDDEFFRIGCIIEHPTFGRGKVVRIEGAGEGLRLQIQFTGIGSKTIMPKYARLKVIG